MGRKSIAVAAMIGIAGGGAFTASLASPAATPQAVDQQSATDVEKICKMVVSAKRGARPYEMCLTKADWDAKKVADAKDATRQVCRYVEYSGTRFRSAKVCMTAAEWENQRLADRQAIERMQMGTCVPGAGC